MKGRPQPERLPRIEGIVRRPGAHAASKFAARSNARLDLTGPDAAAVDLPGVQAGAKVRVDVAAGLRGKDLALVAAFAQRIRDAEVLQIIGTSKTAVDKARSLFLSAWRLEVNAATPEQPQEASVARWAALMLGTVHGNGDAE